MQTEHQLTLPLKNKDQLNSIKVGDIVYVNGTIATSRDMAHKYFYENLENDNKIINELQETLQMGAIYHCGPIINLKNNSVISAGPTTSIREEPYQADIIRLFNLSAIIGKGGMGTNTLAALKKYKCVYLNAVGGAGSYYAKNLTVKNVYFLKDFGMPEAIWILEAKNLFTIATMDLNDNSKYTEIKNNSYKKLKN